MPVEQEFQSGRIRARAVVLISLLGQVAGPGCAKVGDPLPPLSHPPPTIRSLKLVQVDDRIRLHFPLASREVVQVQLFRECPEGASSSEPAMLLDRDQLRRREDGAGFLVEQQLPADGAPCGYFLRFVDTDGRISPPSNLVRASAVKAAAPPRNLRCEVHPDHLRLEWDRPQSNHDGSRPAVVVGYLVNSRHRVSTEAFRDSEFRFGRARRYSVQAISRDADPLILSRASDTLTIVPEDSFAPGAPRNVTAVYWEGEVRVYWDPNREADLAGYFVYRDMEGGTVRRISTLLQNRMFKDTAITEGETYRYRVSAVDESDNESPPSPEASVTIRN